MSNTGGPNDPRTIALLNYLLNSTSQGGAGVTPSLTMGQLGNSYGLVPPDADTGQVNYAQDLNQLAADPVQLARGPGMNQFAPNAFDPLITQTTPDSPSLTTFNMYLTQPNSLSGLIANYIIDGRDPSQILTDLQTKYGFDTPEFDNPELDPIRPFLAYDTDYAGGGTGQPVGIDWNRISEEITRVANEYAQIPRGASGPAYSDDGTLISEGSERSFDIVESGTDANGVPIRQVQVIETTSTPSKMAEEFNRLGLPLPTEEFTPEYILGPNQTALQETYAGMQEPIDAAMQRYLEGARYARDYVHEGPAGVLAPIPGTEDEDTGGPGRNDLGTTRDELVGGQPGIPERNARAEQTAAVIGAAGGQITNVPLSVNDVTHIADPDVFLDWYNANGNSLTDDQRYDVVMHAYDMGMDVFDGLPEGVTWRKVFNDIRDDMGETEGGGGIRTLPEAIADVDIFSGREPGSSGDLQSQASQITDPIEFRDFVAANADALGEDRLRALSAIASNNAQAQMGTEAGSQWSAMANTLLTGEAPAAPSGYASTVSLGSSEIQRLGDLYQQGRIGGRPGERPPEEPPPDLRYEGGPTELFQGGPEQPTTGAIQGTQYGPLDVVGPQLSERNTGGRGLNGPGYVYGPSAPAQEEVPWENMPWHPDPTAWLRNMGQGGRPQTPGYVYGGDITGTPGPGYVYGPSDDRQATLDEMLTSRPADQGGAGWDFPWWAGGHIGMGGPDRYGTPPGTPGPGYVYGPYTGPGSGGQLEQFPGGGDLYNVQPGGGVTGGPTTTTGGLLQYPGEDDLYNVQPGGSDFPPGMSVAEWLAQNQGLDWQGTIDQAMTQGQTIPENAPERYPHYQFPYNATGNAVRGAQTPGTPQGRMYIPGQEGSQYTVDPNYQAPPGGYPTIEEAARHGSEAAIRYLLAHPEGTPDVPRPTDEMRAAVLPHDQSGDALRRYIREHPEYGTGYTVDPNYTAPPGGYATLEEAAANGSQAAIDYLREHPEGTTPVPPAGSVLGGITDAELADIFPNGTGAITPGNYGGGPRDWQTRDEQMAAALPGSESVPGGSLSSIFSQVYQNSRENTEYDKQQMRQVMLEHLRTQAEEADAASADRRSTRTAAERRRLARERAPQGLTTGEILTSPNALRTYSWRNSPAFQEWDRLTDERQRLLHQTYGAEEGYARGLARSLQEQGITPLSMAMMARGLPAAAMGLQGGY